MSKTFILASFCFVTMMVSAAFTTPSLIPSVKAADSWDEELSEEEDPRSDPSRPRLREGTRIASVVGRFSRVGRRWMLELEPTEEQSPPATKSADTNQVRYRVLENLTLQRVVDAIAQDPNDTRWVASGTITEFDGENWLLLTTVFRAHATNETAMAP